MNREYRRFELDRSEGKLLGVCAGLSNSTGLDSNIIRIFLVVVTLMGAFPWTILAYLGAALFASRRAPARTALVLDREESQSRLRALDLRMQAIETCAESANSRLAREIEALR